MKKIFLTLITTLFLFTGCTTNKNIIVKVNNKPITIAQFNTEYKKIASDGMLQQMGVSIPQDENNFMYLMLKDKIVNELIIRELINQEISSKHIRVTNADVNNELKVMIDKIGSKEQFAQILKRNGISNAQFKSDLKEEVKIKKLVNIVAKVKITDKQAQDYYKKNSSQFIYPDKVRASHILISANPQKIEEDIMSKAGNKNISQAILQEKVNAQMNAKKNIAISIRETIKHTPDEFEKVAREKSDDIPTAKNGGDLGFFAKSDMVEPFATQAFTQQPNTISPVIQTQYGYHIIMVTDRMEKGKEPFVKVQDQIKLYLQAQKQMEILENLITQLKASATIIYLNDDYNPIKIQDKLKEKMKEKQQAPSQVNR